MIEIIIVSNVFTGERKKYKKEYTGKMLPSYLEELTGSMKLHTAADECRYDAYLDGSEIMYPDTFIPQPDDQIVITPHVAGGGFKRVFGMVAMIGLMIAAPHNIFGLSSLFMRSLASGAIMILGGRLINSVFKLNQIPQVDVNMSNTYGWELPGVQTQEGAVIGETYGECIPAAQLLMYHVDTKDNDQYLNVLYCGGYGPVEEIKDVRIGYTPVDNFQAVKIEKRLGTNDQEAISFFPNTVSDQSIGLEVKSGLSLTRSTDTDQVNRIDVTIEFPQGIYHTNDDGNFDNLTAKFEIGYRLTGNGTYTTKEYTVTAGTNQAIRKTYTFDDLPTGRYDVRVRGIDLPMTSRNFAYMQWSVLSSYIKTGAFTRPNKVLVALRIKATSQLSGGVPELNWRQKRTIGYVWNPRTNQYDEKSLQNPIWAAYDILHHCRKLMNINTQQYEYVVDGAPAERFTQYFDQWEAAAAYADELVDDGNGGKEKRFQFDAFFDTSMKRIEAANKAASVGHAVILQHGTSYGIAVDKPAVMRQIFGEGRTIMSSFTGSFSSREDRAHSIEIQYNDTQNDFKNTEFFLRSPNLTIDDAQDNTAQLQLFGVSRRSQAYREGMYALKTNERQLQTVTFQADINAIVCEYGDIIGVTHSVPQLGIASGRVVAVNGNVITLDKDVTLQPGQTYQIIIQLAATDEIIKRTVKAVDKAITAKDIIITETTPPIQDMDCYAIGLVDKVAKPFRIIKIETDGDQKVTITAIEYDESVYDDNYTDYPVIDYTTPSPLMAPVDLHLQEVNTTSYAGVKSTTIHATWAMPTGARCDSYHVSYTTDDGVTWTQLPTVYENYVDIPNVDPSYKYTVRVAAVLDARESPYIQSSISLTGNIKPAITPTGLTAYTRYRKLPDGTTRYDVALRWGPGELQARVYYKINHITAAHAAMPKEGISADEIGYIGAWTYAGIGAGEAVIPQTVPGDTYRLAVCSADELGNYTLPDAAPHLDLLVAVKTMIPNTPDNFTVWFDTQTHVSWSAVINTDIAFYEVRADQHAGTKSPALLVRTNSLTAIVSLANRTGRLYLYACGIDGKYSAAAELQYGKSEPPKPAKPTVTAKLGGMSIETYAIPTDCIGIVYNIDGKQMESTNTVYTYTCEAGIYDVKVAYRDLFGIGPWSDEVTCVVKTKVDKDLLEEESVTLKTVDENIKNAIKNAQDSVDQIADLHNETAGLKKTDEILQNTIKENKEAQNGINEEHDSQIKQTTTAINTIVENLGDSDKADQAYKAISQINQTAKSISSTVMENQRKQEGINEGMTSQINQTAQSITSVITDLNDVDKKEHQDSTIAQFLNAITLRVRSDKIISEINATPETIRILSKLIHISGDTLFDDNVIVGKMLSADAVTSDKIAAGAVTAEKINVKSLSTITAKIGRFQSGEDGKARTVITDSLEEIYDDNNVLRVRIGVW